MSVLALLSFNIFLTRTLLLVHFLNESPLQIAVADRCCRSVYQPIPDSLHSCSPDIEELQLRKLPRLLAFEPGQRTSHQVRRCLFQSPAQLTALRDAGALGWACIGERCRAVGWGGANGP
jgi:hypothetical protein